MNPHFVQPLFRSSIPLLLGGTFSLVKGLSSNSSFRHFLNKNLLNKSHETAYEVKSEELRTDFLAYLDQISFGIYSDFWTFLFAMLLIELFLEVAQNITRRFGSRIDSSKNIIKEWKLFGLVSENQIKRIFSCAVIFMILQMTGMGLSFIQTKFLPTIHQVSVLTPYSSSQDFTMRQQDHNFGDVSRILEEEKNYEQVLSSSVAMIPDKISLSMGNVLSSLSLSVNAMVLSKDKKTAFVTIDFYGNLKIIDISDPQSPLVLGSLSLRLSTESFRIKSLILSSDEKTLYTSNSRDLEVIDVTDLRSPKLLSERRSPLFETIDKNELSPHSKPSLAVSERTKTLYIGGLGLQIYNISNPEDPVLLKAFKNDPKTYNQELTRNEICLSRDEKILFIANGTLDIYNVSNPGEMKLLNSFKTKSSPRSLTLLEESKTVLLLGKSENAEVIFEEANISRLESLEVRKTLTLSHKSYDSPRFLAITPSKSKVFIFISSAFAADFGLLVLDRIKETAGKAARNLIQGTFTMDFGLDGKTLVTGSNNQFMMVELFLDYPNHQVFSASQENLIKNISLSYCSDVQVSGDGNYLFAFQVTRKQIFTRDFVIWDVKNFSSPKSLYSTQTAPNQMYFTNNYQTVYLISDESIMILDIANRDEIKLKNKYVLENEKKKIAYFIPSSDGKTGFMVRSFDEKGDISFVELSSSNTSEVVKTLDLDFNVENSRLILKDDDRTLIFVGDRMIIYDISNILDPQKIISFPFCVDEPDPKLGSHVLSPDGEILFIETFDENGFFKLKIYNISEVKAPRMISETYFPKLERTWSHPGLSISADLNTGYVFYQENSLIKVNLTDLRQPQIAGVIPLATNKKPVNNYVLSPKGKTIYVNMGLEIRVLNMDIEYSLFLKQEKFLLGKKYSNSLGMLHLSESDEYTLMDTKSYKPIKLSLLDMKVAPNDESLDMKYSALPSWMMFDRESNTWSVEAKKQGDIGNYTLCSTFSLKISNKTFDKLGTAENPVPLQDLWAWLISLDYIDPKLYLTENFGQIDDFLLPSNFSLYREEIYRILKKSHVETCTSFEVVSSLVLKEGQKNMTVSSLTTSNIEVDIKLEPRQGVDARFVNTNYASLIPVMKDFNKTKISLEGSLKEINAALDSVVVNFENGTSCDISMIIMDGLNPPLSAKVANVSRYFKANVPPSVNQNIDKTVQEQINIADIQTGKYFTWTFSGDVFEDEYAEKHLEYDFVMANNNTAFPIWLDWNGLTLKGTPPEELSGRDLDLILIAKNEFKKNQIPFRLHISISAVFWFKLVLKYSPYILTMVYLSVPTRYLMS